MTGLANIDLAAALLGLFPFITGCGHLAPSRAAGVATGYLSHQLCSAVFVSGRSPESAYREMIEPLTGSVALFMRHTVDRGSAEVRASFAGVADSRAVYRAPWGCTIVNDAVTLPSNTNIKWVDLGDLAMPIFGDPVDDGGTQLPVVGQGLQVQAQRVSGTGTLAVSQWTDYTNGQATISGGTLTFNNLTNINGAGFQVSGGGSQFAT